MAFAFLGFLVLYPRPVSVLSGSCLETAGGGGAGFGSEITTREREKEGGRERERYRDTVVERQREIIRRRTRLVINSWRGQFQFGQHFKSSLFYAKATAAASSFTNSKRRNTST